MVKVPNMDHIKRIHFVGIAGAGMSGIAEVLATQGYQVSGSDLVENAVTKHLQSLGVRILQGHIQDNIQGAEIVVYSSAIPKDNPELMAAQNAHIPILARAQMLAELMRPRYGIAIAGTHGKTTTTGLTTTLLTEGGFDPTFVIGGVLVSMGTHARLGASPYFVAEADESDASFLYLQPKVAIVTNIDTDHLNNYGDFAHLQASFLEFIHRLPADGLAVLCSDDVVVQSLLPQIKRPYLTYGFQPTDAVRVRSYRQEGLRCVMTVEREGHATLDVVLNLPGRHNVLNSLAAIAVATHCGVSDAAIIAGLAKFQGTRRRFQVYGEYDTGQGKVLLIDDYGHHPREIAATMEAVRSAWPERRLVLAFQPHRYTRTQAIFQDFVQVLSQANVLLLLDIYSAGETPIPGISGESLWNAIHTHSSHQAIFVPQVKQLPQALHQVLQDGDILLTQGAGDISKMATYLADMGLKVANWHE